MQCSTGISYGKSWPPLIDIMFPLETKCSNHKRVHTPPTFLWYSRIWALCSSECHLLSSGVSVPHRGAALAHMVKTCEDAP